MDLKALRKKAKLTQIELAKRLSVHKQQVFNWERGSAPIPFKHAAKLAKQLDISEKKLIDFIIEKRNENFLRAIRARRATRG